MLWQKKFFSSHTHASNIRPQIITNAGEGRPRVMLSNVEKYKWIHAARMIGSSLGPGDVHSMYQFTALAFWIHIQSCRCKK